ncbi:NAD(P)-binding protein [Neocallimastix lanati (nom. inval.)]|jgi:NAD(P)-dependent dehydrogenase (short-subunit alcohol dehydrogenase family)|uniref:NAD(P)-binding protein n=1 Tax=Neocallimastix californiae TaxID=1754190 RepID=A0A1Y2EMD9_9FUNG|nr:NAD(P)-binding protein [Neocallimastix sp. JGI-2020a]ORY72679.1 NAD(P)-binding protein [Neocallimastix californiae]|eukprot:ORY72679.1 NAD(P)-binding protein [Neocallimastix californiae]
MKLVEVPDQTGKVVVITGYRGLAYHSALALAKANAEIILLARNVDKAKENAEKLKEESNNQKISVEYLDLNKLDTVRTFAKSYIESKRPIHVLMNNAGIMALKDRKVTEDGNEFQFQTNYLGHFLLTHLLLPVLKQSAPARIVCLSSIAHIPACIHMKDLNLEKKYNPWRSYCQSKLACLLFAKEMSRRLVGTNITINAVHPGVVDTPLWNEIISYFPFGRKIYPIFRKIVMITPEQGAQTQIYVASSKECETATGNYYAGARKWFSINPLSYYKKLHKELYEKSLEMVGLEQGIEPETSQSQKKND